MKILIIGPSWVGDMVMSQSLYITLQKLHPKAIIDVMAPAWCRSILERMPQINQAIEMPLEHGDFSLFKRWALGKQLQKNNYTHAYVLPNSAKSTLIPLFARIPIRIGWKGEMRYGLLNDLRNNKKSFQYMVERYVALAYPKKKMLNSSSLGGLNKLPFPSLSIDIEAQKKVFAKLNLNTHKTILGLCPGAEFGPSKQWPIEYYAQVANEAINKGYQVFIFGSMKDKGITESIQYLVDAENQKSLINLAGKTSLIEVVDLLAMCKTVVSNDSGLMHIAAAVGCHIIAVYGSTSPNYTPPLTKKVDIVSSDIECRPCFQRECPLGHLKCLKELKPQLILDKITSECN